MDMEEFRVDRVARMDTIADNLLPEVETAIQSGDNDALLAAVAKEFTAIFADQPGFAIADTPAEAWSWFKQRIMPGIDAIKSTSAAETVAGWLGTAIVNGARVAAAEGANKTWISRKDGKVRPFHVEAHGQTVLWSDPFTVCGGVEVLFPGEPVGDPSCWINCRCVAAPASMVSGIKEVVEMALGEDTLDDLEPSEDELADDGFEDELFDDEDIDGETLGSDLQWHGALAPEGVKSGDGRMFSEGALTWRDLPLPLRWQESDTGGHDGAVTIATIDRIERRGNLLMAEGRFLDMDMSDRVVGMIGEGALKGVSIDADSAQLAEGSTEGEVQFSKGRISAATLVAIPAFAEAYIALGPLPDMVEEDDLVTSDTTLADETVRSVEELTALMTAAAEEFAKRGNPQKNPRPPRKKHGKYYGPTTPKPPAKPKGRTRPPTAKATRKANVGLKEGREGGYPGWARRYPSVPMPRINRVVPGRPTLPSKTALDDLEVFVDGLTAFMDGVVDEFRAVRRKPPKAKSKAQPKNRSKDPRTTPPKKRALAPLRPRTTTPRKAPPQRSGFFPQPRANWKEKAWGPGYADPGDRKGYSGSRDEFRDVDKAERDRLAKKGEAMKDGSFPIANVQDLKNAIQAIGRAKDPDAAKTHIKKRANALGHPELVPGYWATDTDEFARGPGWITNPKETRRLHAYWTQPGHAGYAKVRWGTPGDFTRLRRFLSKYIPLNLLNRVTAQWHHDAVGYWPGEAGRPGNPPVGAHRDHRFDAEPINLVAASIVPVESRYFDDPKFDGPQGLIVDGDHVYGHIAAWSTCHIGIKDVCTTPPHSNRDYAFFRTGAVLTDKGRISVGQLTLGTGHAGLSAGARQAAAHYDNTGTVVADVAAGEDDHGIWVAGKVRDSATPEQVHALQAGAISGDWRAIGGELELIAALVVNVPGFPVSRPSLAADGGEQISLVAAGVLLEDSGQLPDIAAVADAVIEELSRREAAEIAQVSLN